MSKSQERYQQILGRTIYLDRMQRYKLSTSIQLVYKQWNLEVSGKEFHEIYYVCDNIHEKIARFLLSESTASTLQFKCNTSARSVTPVQITHRDYGL